MVDDGEEGTLAGDRHDGAGDGERRLLHAGLAKDAHPLTAPESLHLDVLRVERRRGIFIANRLDASLMDGDLLALLLPAALLRALELGTGQLRLCSGDGGAASHRGGGPRAPNGDRSAVLSSSRHDR